MTEFERFCIDTQDYNELIPIGDRVREAVARSSISNGIVHVITAHTTTGITVNERLECLQDDILHQLAMLFPENGDYHHARFLHGYGAMAGNPTGHLKSMVAGNHATVPLVDGRLCLGRAQELFLAEFDGPQQRTITLTIIGD